jgi:hypothetical protein
MIHIQQRLNPTHDQMYALQVAKFAGRGKKDYREAAAIILLSSAQQIMTDGNICV